MKSPNGELFLMDICTVTTDSRRDVLVFSGYMPRGLIPVPQ